MKSLEMLKRLVEKDSSFKEGANKLLDSINGILEVKAKEFEFNGWKSLYISKNERPDVLLLAHLDTVSALNWKDKNPLQMEIAGNTAFGLGICDMKASVAAIIQIIESWSNPKVAFLITTDEEIGGINGAMKLSEIIKPKFVIALEPTDLKIQLFSKGFLNLKIKCLGKSGHSSMPKNAVNAIEKLNEFIAEVRKLEILRVKNRLLGKSTVSQTMISCHNLRENQIPDFCETVLNFRIVPEINRDNLMKKIKQLAESNGFISVEDYGNVPFGTAMNCSKDNRFVKLLNTISNTSFIGKPFASDARFFSQKGISSICFGPKGGNIHGPDEWIDINAFDDFISILRKFIEVV